jgi:hypothetical protein
MRASRSFTISDALILVAAAAIGTASLRFTVRDLDIGGYFRHWPAPATHAVISPLGRVAFLYARTLVNGVPLLVLASCTSVCLSARRRRLRPASQLALQQGLLLDLTIITVAAATVALRYALRVPGEDWQSAAWKTLVFSVITNVGSVVLFTLVLLKLTRRHTPVRSKSDAASRLLAWIWVALLVLERCRSYLERVHIM